MVPKGNPEPRVHGDRTATIASLAVGARVGGALLCHFGAAGGLALEASGIFLVTLCWKISLHCATLARTAALVWKLTGSPVALLLGIPLMIWSRLLLRRHTPAQTIAGTLVGFLSVVLFFDLFAGTV